VTEEPDRGAADPRVAAALASYHGGELTEHDALAVLAGSRLLVPVVAMLAEAGPDGAEKETDMALPTLIGNDGRRAVIAFTGVQAMAKWRPDARPVPVPARKVCEAAIAEADAVVVDLAGPVQVEISGARLAALAAGRDTPPAHEDPDVRAAVAAAVAGVPGIAGFTLGPGDGADLVVTLEQRGTGTEDATRAAGHITGRLWPRLRKIEIRAAYAG
jgi:hypothetical protein